MQPPLILKYNAATVPIIQLAISSNKLTESQLFDFGNQVIRAQVGTIYGAAIPYPFGGATRQVQIDLKPDALRAQGLTANDVNNAITNQNLIVPAGTQKIGDTEYNVKLNSSPLKIQEINDLPIRGNVGGNVTYIRDVAFVHDGHPPQTNIVRVNGRRAVLMSIQKTGAASTLNIINEIKKRLPRVREVLPRRSVDQHDWRPVGVRACRGEGRGDRSRHRRLPDRPDGAAVPGQLAQHFDHCDLDSAVDPVVHHHPGCAWARLSI